jgi:hypothetical protein
MFYMKFFAYIDPGLGALIWQSFVAGVIGFLFYLKKSRRWIVDVIRKMLGRGKKPHGLAGEIPAMGKVEIKSDAR